MGLKIHVMNVVDTSLLVLTELLEVLKFSKTCYALATQGGSVWMQLAQEFFTYGEVLSQQEVIKKTKEAEVSKPEWERIKAIDQNV